MPPVDGSSMLPAVMDYEVLGRKANGVEESLGLLGSRSFANYVRDSFARSCGDYVHYRVRPSKAVRYPVFEDIVVARHRA